MYEQLLVSTPSKSRRQRELNVPCEDGIDTVLENEYRRLERQRVSQEGSKEIVAHGQEARQDALPHSPSEQG